MELIDTNSEIFKELVFPLEEKTKLLATIKRETEEWLGGHEVCRMLKISQRTLQTYRDTRVLPYSSIRGKFFYSKKDIDELMRGNYIPSRKD